MNQFRLKMIRDLCALVEDLNNIRLRNMQSYLRMVTKAVGVIHMLIPNATDTIS